MSTHLVNIAGNLGFSKGLSDLDSALSAAGVTVTSSGERVVTIFERRDMPLDEVVRLVCATVLECEESERDGLGSRCIGRVTELYKKSSRELDERKGLVRVCASVRKHSRAKQIQQQCATIDSLCSLLNRQPQKYSNVAKALQNLKSALS